MILLSSSFYPQQATGYHDDEARQPLMEDARRQEVQAQLQQQEAVIDYDSALFEEREEQIRQIEVCVKRFLRLLD